MSHIFYNRFLTIYYNSCIFDIQTIMCAFFSTDVPKKKNRYFQNLQLGARVGVPFGNYILRSISYFCTRFLRRKFQIAITYLLVSIHWWFIVIIHNGLGTVMILNRTRSRYYCILTDGDDFCFFFYIYNTLFYDISLEYYTRNYHNIILRYIGRIV